MESFCHAIFKKDIYQLNAEDLATFFASEQEETSVLEFKSGDVEIDKIYSEVAAFMNTEGGLLIIGAPKEKLDSTKTKKICIGDLSPSVKIKSKDILSQKIASNITPAPINIKIQEIVYGTGKVYVVDIPFSMTPPHQVSNEGKYYIRLEKEAKPAPHGLISAMFNRRKNSLLEIEYDIFMYKKLLHVNVKFANTNAVPCEDWGFIITIEGIAEIIGEKPSELFREKMSLSPEQCNITCTELPVLIRGVYYRKHSTFIPKRESVLVKTTIWGKNIDPKTRICIFSCTDGTIEKNEEYSLTTNEPDTLPVEKEYLDRLKLLKS